MICGTVGGAQIKIGRSGALLAAYGTVGQDVNRYYLPFSDPLPPAIKAGRATRPSAGAIVREARLLEWTVRSDAVRCSRPGPQRTGIFIPWA